MPHRHSNPALITATQSSLSHEQELLYCGPELRLAARRSHLTCSRPGRLEGTRNAVIRAGALATSRFGRRVVAEAEVVVAKGAVPGSASDLTVAYAGSGENQAWCFSTALGNYEVIDRARVSGGRELSRLLAGVAGEADLLFHEGPARGYLGREGIPFVSMPAWIKQQLPLCEDWPVQIDLLPRDTRQEIGRILRKYRYQCHLTRDLAHHADFYDHLYKPYVAKRFGSAALVVDRAAFLTECSRGALLRLTSEDSVLGAALLRPTGRTLAVVWSALHSSRDPGGLRGATDALDYFSLLYAHLLRCRRMDMGPSRPDLNDGILRYKAKWGCQITPGLTRQPTIEWTCRGENAGIREFLHRQAFLLRARRGLRVALVVDGDTDPEALAAKITSGLRSGIANYRVIVSSPASARLMDIRAKLGPKVSLVYATTCSALISAMSAA